ncbi:4-(cytidine 5'-diphospho)-2-C-methyl-D-erythritol kinase [bacterium]|nr:4-(cytidine 5'-diphospho)-2-C-methyl-D-erythritol kinase [bacterium]
MVKMKQRKNQEIYSVSYAKINLILNVESLLDSGYNKIRTLFSEIDLSDNLKYSLTKSKEIEVWSNIAELCGQRNLIYTVATYLKDIYSVDRGVKIELEKHIPLAAGLGGGSSNAANAIKALNTLWSLNMTKDEMHTIAAKFGSDLNFFLEGGTALGSNRGEIIERIEPINLDKILLVKPALGISSAEAYKLINIRETNSNFDKFIETKDLELLFNDLQTGIIKKYPEISNILEQLQANGAEVAQMSGSGSTCFGIYTSAELLKQSYDYFKTKGYWTKITKTI